MLSNCKDVELGFEMGFEIHHSDEEKKKLNCKNNFPKSKLLRNEIQKNTIPFHEVMSHYKLMTESNLYRESSSYKEMPGIFDEEIFEIKLMKSIFVDKKINETKIAMILLKIFPSKRYKKCIDLIIKAQLKKYALITTVFSHRHADHLKELLSKTEPPIYPHSIEIKHKITGVKL